MTTTPHGQVPEALPAIQRFEVVDCIDSKHVPAVIPKPHGPWVRYEDHAAALCRLHAYCQELEAQVIRDCMTHVQNPAEIEHAANDVSKNGVKLNISTQQTAPPKGVRQGSYETGWKDGYKHGAWSTQQPAPATQQAGEVLSDDLRDRLVAISEAVADQDDRAAQAMLREILKAPRADSVTAPAETTPHPARKPDTLVNGGALKIALNVLRRAGENEVADELLRTAQAVPDSVLEDAARLDFLIKQRAYVVSDPDACPGYWLHFFHKETGKCWTQSDEHPTPRAAIDAAMAANGGNK